MREGVLLIGLDMRHTTLNTLLLADWRMAQGGVAASILTRLCTRGHFAAHEFLIESLRKTATLKLEICVI